MPNISIGLDFGWQIAAVETAHGQREFIEPEHLFVGVCKVGNLAAVNDWREVQLPESLKEALKAEAESIKTLFDKFELEHVALYREVRQRKGPG